MRSIHVLPVVLGLAGLLGCGGSGSGTPAPRSSAMNVTLVDGPTTAYTSILLSIQSVEISRDGGSWMTLGTVGGTPVDLLTLTGGVSRSLLRGVALDPGSYGQMRLILGSTGNSVVLKDGTTHALTVPSGAQTGIKLIGPFVVQAGTTADIWIDFDAAHSVQVVGAGASGKYLLRPTCFAYEKAVTGSITGILTDQADGSALAGVPVFAEVLDGAGKPSIVRSATTGATGAYTLDLLPVGGTYYVVSLPAPGTFYGPKASDGFSLTSATPTFTFSAAFTATAGVGTLNGTVTPLATASQSDGIDLLATLASTPGGATHTFILDRDMAVVGATETFTFGSLPAGTYSLVGNRTTTAGDGSTTVAVAVPVAATVTAGATTAATVAF
ncbi:DUF4382 domain-containing protein [Geothrix sp. 21YS21S-2]|uniref:DUF4382 domain-containing protein n=1 Tax=Geothrix sp. 21YS21S-2 TaxID=3068893 RepID=UPI0027B881C0|nr:DUF4382 domain-containing protein [Geothrix sp. 21YS21S-2]